MSFGEMPKTTTSPGGQPSCFAVSSESTSPNWVQGDQHDRFLQKLLAGESQHRAGLVVGLHRVDDHDLPPVGNHVDQVRPRRAAVHDLDAPRWLGERHFTNSLHNVNADALVAKKDVPDSQYQRIRHGSPSRQNTKL